MRQVEYFDGDDVHRATIKGMLFGGVVTAIGMAAAWSICSILNGDSAHFSRLGRAHIRAVSSLRDKFTDTQSLMVIPDTKNSAHLSYIDHNGNVFVSVNCAQIDAKNAIIVVFHDHDEDGMISAGENPQYFSDVPAAIKYVESLARNQK